MSNKKERKHQLKTEQKKGNSPKKSQVLEVVLSLDARRKELIQPTRKYTVNELVISNLLRGLELAMAKRTSEKLITSSSVIRNSDGKTLVFVADVGNITGKVVEFINLTLVGEKLGGINTPVKHSISNLVAESFIAHLDDFNFQELSGKLLLGTTIMFSAKVNIKEDIPYLEGFVVEDFGLRLFQEDGTVDSLAIFNHLVDTYNYEYFDVKSGVLVPNEYRNTSLDSYLDAYSNSGDKKHLHKASEYIIGTYDDPSKLKRTTLAGLVKAVPIK